MPTFNDRLECFRSGACNRGPIKINSQHFLSHADEETSKLSISGPIIWTIRRSESNQRTFTSANFGISWNIYICLLYIYIVCIMRYMYNTLYIYIIVSYICRICFTVDCLIFVDQIDRTWPKNRFFVNHSRPFFYFTALQFLPCQKNDMFPMLPAYMGVSKNRGTPKWMVYKGKPY